MKNKSNSDLQNIPGVGPRTEQELQAIGIKCVRDLKGKDPEELYEKMCKRKGTRVDRCELYVFRCAVYYADHERRDPRRLKWWNWKDK
jgi:hypothetical protein